MSCQLGPEDRCATRLRNIRDQSTRRHMQEDLNLHQPPVWALISRARQCFTVLCGAAHLLSASHHAVIHVAVFVCLLHLEAELCSLPVDLASFKMCST